MAASSTSSQWGATDRENVDPLTGHLSTLPAGSGTYGAAPSSKKTGGQVATMLGRRPLTDLTDLFSQQLPSAPLEAAEHAASANLPQGSQALLKQGLLSCSSRAAPPVPTSNLRMMR